MTNYEELMARLGSGQYEHQIDALKKLVYLSVNDQTTFKRFAIRILAELFVLMPQLHQQETKLLSLQLLSEIAGSYKQFVPKNEFIFENVVACLSDDSKDIRKSSHYMILTFVKKYQQLDPVLQSYQQIGSNNACPWKLTQKILHSFQSLIVVEPRCVKYSKDITNVDTFLDFVFQKDVSDNALVKKASSQVLTSFVKNQYVPEIITQLNKNITNKLLQHSKSINYFPFSEKINRMSSINKNQDLEDDHIEEITIGFTPSIVTTTSQSTNNNITFSPQSPFRKGSSTDKKKQKLVIRDISPLNENKADPLQSLIEKIHSSEPWNVKCQAICDIKSYISTTPLVTISDIFIERVLELTNDLNFRTRITSLETLGFFVNEYFRELRTFQERLEDILADKICDMKAAMRKEASKICRELIITYNEHRIVRILMQRVKTCSFAGKEEILDLMHDVYTVSVQQDAGFIVGQLATLLFQDNTSIKSKTMSVILAISEGSNIEQCKAILSKKLNKVYFQMFLQKLNERTNQKTEQPKSTANSLQIQTSHFTSKQENQYAMTYTDMRTNVMGRVAKEGVNTVSNFGSLPNHSPDQRLGIIGKRKVQEADREEEKQKDKAYQYKPMLNRKNNQKVQAQEQMPQEFKKQPGQLIVQSKQYRVKRPSDHRKQEYKKQEFKRQQNRNQQRIEEEKPSQQEKVPLKVNTKPFSSKKSSSIAKYDEQPNMLLKKTISSKQPRIPDYKTTTYTSKQEIEPLQKPEGALKKIAVDIKKDDNWSLQFQSLNSIRKILKHHKNQYLLLIQNLPIIMPEVLKLVESLRSSLAKNAMITLSQMCESLKKQMDSFLELIFPKLFKKGCDTNSFISEEARKCISFLCYYCSPQKIVPIILSGCQTKQAQVRLLIVLMVQKLSSRTNIQPMVFLRQNIKIVNILGQYLVDSSSEVRTSTKTLILGLAVNTSKSEVEQLFRKNIPEDAFSRLKTILEKELVGGMVVRNSSKNIDL